MEKYTVCIEETISQDFEVEADTAEEAYKIAQQKYDNDEFVLDNADLQSGQMAVINQETGEFYDWREF